MKKRISMLVSTFFCPKVWHFSRVFFNMSEHVACRCWCHSILRSLDFRLSQLSRRETMLDLLSTTSLQNPQRMGSFSPLPPLPVPQPPALQPPLHLSRLQLPPFHPHCPCLLCPYHFFLPPNFGHSSPLRAPPWSMPPLPQLSLSCRLRGQSVTGLPGGWASSWAFSSWHHGWGCWWHWQFWLGCVDGASKTSGCHSKFFYMWII